MANPSELHGKNALLMSYIEETGLSSKELAKRLGLSSHSQLYMARTQHVAHKNAELISSGIARMLNLSAGERLELKAEIMGHPKNILRVYFGYAGAAAKTLEISPANAKALLSTDRTISPRTGTHVLKRLEQIGAPEEVMQIAREKMRPEAPRPPGKRTHNLTSDFLSRRHREAPRELNRKKPRTAAAIERSGLSRKELYQRAGIGRETLRMALYRKTKRATAEKIASVLAESDEERSAIRLELVSPPLASLA